MNIEEVEALIKNAEGFVQSRKNAYEEDEIPSDYLQLIQCAREYKRTMELLNEAIENSRKMGQDLLNKSYLNK